MMIDLRCPACNVPVKGREDVVHRSSWPTIPAVCPNCKTGISLVESETPVDSDEPEYYLADV